MPDLTPLATRLEEAEASRELDAPMPESVPEPYCYTAEELADGERYATLGPAYFRARAIAERVTADLEPEGFGPLMQQAADAFMDIVWDKVRDHIVADTEQNVQGEIRAMVEGTINALLTGQAWALRQYPLAQNYDGQRLRAAIVELCGSELRDKEARDADLEARRLADTYRWWRSDRVDRIVEARREMSTLAQSPALVKGEQK